jgi:hypothetical protein
MDPQKNDGAGTPKPEEEATTPNEFKVDGVDAPSSGASDTPSDPAAAPAEAPATEASAENSVAFTTDSAGNVQAVPGSESESSETPAVDANAGASSETPAADQAPVGSDPTANAGDQFNAVPTPDAGSVSSSALPSDAASSDGAGVPPVAPVPAPHGDKKTVIILGAVAVVLLAAIAFLFFM